MSKVVLITGASSGIGKTIAHYLSDKGFTVYGTSRNPKAVKEGEVRMIPLDVTVHDSITAAIQTILQEQNQIDYLINNAGMGITGPLEETPDNEIRRVFETNYFGALEVIKAVLPTMRAQRSGMIINVTSIAGYMGLPYRGIYSATKGALGITTEAYRMELKEFNVKMTTVAPGDFATNIAAGRYHAPILENSPYKENYGNTLQLMDEHVDAGMDTQVMAKVVYRIMLSKNPKVHYRVGFFMQKFSIALKRILPDTWYEKLLLNHYKL
ncbi:SDR family oxidoreductase [uncultured Dokdonia sp.]|uniref:SDR family oxidoreductase n=1 Tax=uncultured Dokdonia sp. TaxID=575653 RepID=UPI00262D0204|nr:SDR family oxidoreductase [uncultured Dokdonia sp.]